MPVYRPPDDGAGAGGVRARTGVCTYGLVSSVGYKEDEDETGGGCFEEAALSLGALDPKSAAKAAFFTSSEYTLRAGCGAAFASSSAGGAVGKGALVAGGGSTTTAPV